MKIFWLILLISTFSQVNASEKSKDRPDAFTIHTNLRESKFMPENYYLRTQMSYGETGLQSQKGPYRASILDNQSFNFGVNVEYMPQDFLSFAVGPSATFGTKNQSESYFNKDITAIHYNDYRLNGYLFLNYVIDHFLFRPYAKLGIGYGQFNINFNSQKEGFSDLDDSILSVSGSGVVSEYGVGAEGLFYKGFGLFAELVYKNFDVKSVDYKINGELADYEKTLITKNKGPTFTGFSIQYGVIYNF